METIGLIAAMPQESAALLRQVKEWKRSALDSFRCYRFRLSDRDCLLVTSGMGIQRAAQATRALLKSCAPTILVSFGVAGAVQADLKIGDVVAASRTCLLEKGALAEFQLLALLSDAARQAADQALLPRGARLVSGTAVTTRGSQVLPSLSDHLEHPILEMETTGIARAAAERGIPLVSLRAISDGPRAPIPFDLESLTDEQYNLQMGRLLAAVLRHPGIIFQSAGLMRNTRQAADNAAIGLAAALSQPYPVVSSS